MLVHVVGLISPLGPVLVIAEQGREWGWGSGFDLRLIGDRRVTNKLRLRRATRGSGEHRRKRIGAWKRWGWDRREGLVGRRGRAGVATLER